MFECGCICERGGTWLTYISHINEAYVLENSSMYEETRTVRTSRDIEWFRKVP